MTIRVTTSLSFFIIALLIPTVATAQVVYSVVPYDIDVGYSIDGGTITVSDTAHANGTLELAEIVSYAIDGTDLGGPHAITGPPLASINGTVLIDGSTISIPDDSVAGGALFLYGSAGSGGPQWVTANSPLTYFPQDFVAYIDRSGGGSGELALPDGDGILVAEVVVKGDANDDGALNNLDTTAFGLALFNPVAYAAAYPGVNPDVVLDMNNDGDFNNLDISEFGSALGF